MPNFSIPGRKVPFSKALFAPMLAAAPLAIGVLAPQTATATVTGVYSLFSQNGAAEALNYAVFGLGGAGKTNVDLSAVTVDGNLAVGPSGSLSLAAPSTVNGNIDMDSTATPTNPGPGKYTGTLNTNENFSSLVTDIADASTQAEGLTATQTFSGITAGTTVTGVSGLNVIDISGNINLNNLNLTFAGPAAAQFVVNVGGSIALVGSASILAGSNVSDGNILLNLYTSSGTVNTKVGDTIDGVVLAPTASFNLDGVFNGELISGGSSLSLLSNATVNYSSPSVPEPAALSLLVIPAMGLLLLKRRSA